jgi:hypothetical protein
LKKRDSLPVFQSIPKKELKKAAQSQKIHACAAFFNVIGI